MITQSECACALPVGKARRRVIRSQQNPFIESGRSHPPQIPATVIKLPLSWRICPLCGLHYVQKGKASPRLCFLIKDA